MSRSGRKSATRCTLGAVRPRRRPRIRGLRARDDGIAGRRRNCPRAVPSRVRGESVRDLATAAFTRCGSRPVDPSRILISRVARRHGLRVSLSPKPFADSVGSGAHQHISLLHDRRPLFSGGDGARGLNTAGAAAIGGICPASSRRSWSSAVRSSPSCGWHRVVGPVPTPAGAPRTGRRRDPRTGSRRNSERCHAATRGHRRSAHPD